MKRAMELMQLQELLWIQLLMKRKLKVLQIPGYQKILLNHLKNYKGKLDEKGKEIAAELLAFSPEGIEEMNKNIAALNNGKFHQPIFKVRTYELKGEKFNVGQTRK